MQDVFGGEFVDFAVTWDCGLGFTNGDFAVVAAFFPNVGESVVFGELVDSFCEVFTLHSYSLWLFTKSSQVLFTE